MPKRWKNVEKMKRAFLNGRTILVFLLVLMTISTGVLAKYVWVTNSEYAQISSPPFYFTADVLGDSEMIKSETDETYSYEDKQSGTWHLYGNGAHEINFSIRNYYDDLRITQDEITYSVTLLDSDSIGATLIASDGSSLATPSTLGVANESGEYETAEQKLCLTIPSGAKAATVTVMITSTKPYKKTLELSFVLHPADQGLTYEIIDSANSPYAELIIRNGTDRQIQPYIDWSMAGNLLIDNTNALTFHIDEKGVFTPQEGMAEQKIQISRPLNPHESVSLYFFKSDRQNYSQSLSEQLPVGASPDYYIVIKSPT